MENTRASVQKQRPKGVIGLPESLPISVQKSYSMLTKAERNIGLRKYRPGHSKPILVGEENLLKPALRLMSQYRLRIEEIKGTEVVTSYTRRLECVQARGAENPEVTRSACTSRAENILPRRGTKVQKRSSQLTAKRMTSGST
jgi:hypothetical protein